MDDHYTKICAPTNQQSMSWWRKISVEPVMILYMGSYMLNTVLEQAFFVYKACSVDLKLPATICANISAKENKQYLEQVQVVVSTFHQYESIASNAVPIVLAFYAGAWSDRVGRKLPLLIGLAGYVVYWMALALNSAQDSWPLQMVLYTATFPSALTGSNLVIFMSSVSYICDITTTEERGVRVTLLEIAYLSTMPVGVTVGSYLFKHVMEQSYTLMFLLSGGIMVIAFIYALLRLTWRTNKTKHASPISCVGTVCSTIGVITKSRPDRYAVYLRLVIFAMAVYSFQRDEKNMAYLYTTLKFNWDTSTYSTFRTYQSTLYIFGLLVGTPILGKVLKMKDTVIVMFAATSHFVARVIFATTTHPIGFYIGAAFGALGPAVAPILRSIASKLVPISERGKALSMLSVADSAVPIVSATIYSQLYNATISTAPSSIFWVTAFTQALVFAAALTIQGMRGPSPLEQALDPEEDSEETT